jgi:hypothetical protein
MAYLVKNDYRIYIQGDYFNQLVQGDDTKRFAAEDQAMADVFNRLVQRYDLGSEFTNTAPYDKTKAYRAGERAIIALAANGFATWVTGTSYSVGDLVIYQSVGYRCTTANSDTSFTSSKWAAQGALNDMFYAAFPPTCTIQGQPNPQTLMEPYAPVFDYRKNYAVGDVVFWRNNTYVCVQASQILSQEGALQYVNTFTQPLSNVFPDDPVNNNAGQYWGSRTAYTIPANTPLTDTAAWVKGDNRNQTIKTGMVVLSVFRLSALIAPENRPEAWLEDYKGVLRDLNSIAQGEMAIQLPQIQPRKGLKTMYGSQVKNQNNY